MLLLSCFPSYFLISIGLGQVQLKLGDLRSSLSNFEKVLEVYPDNCETLKVSKLVDITAVGVLTFYIYFNLYWIYFDLAILLGSWAHISAAWAA